MSKKSKVRLAIAALFMNLLVFVLYGTPFFFVLLNAFKERRAAARMNIQWPQTWHPENFSEVFRASDGQLVTAFKNSFLITAMVVILTVLLCATTGFFIQRRASRLAKSVNYLLLFGLMIPVAVMPTIWVLQALRLYRLKIGLVLVMAAVGMPFSTMLYRSYAATIPKEIDEAAMIDGCHSGTLFFRIIFPVMKPVTATVVILSAINTFNDFANPLYFLPGAENATVQLTLYNFMGAYSNQWNLVFANVVIICIPMLVLFGLFNRQIVTGMTGGAIKG